MSRADGSDIERIQQWIAFCSMPGEENPTLEAIARQFPRMLAALRFVEEHGGAVKKSLETRHGYFAERDMPEVREALEALRRLTAERGEP